MPTRPLLPVLLAALVGAAAAARHQLHIGAGPQQQHHHGRQVLSMAYPPSYPPPYYGGGDAGGHHGWSSSTWGEDSDAWEEAAAVAGSRRAVLSTSSAADGSEERSLRASGLWGALEDVRMALLTGDGFDDPSLRQHSVSQRSLMSMPPGYYSPPPYGGAPIPDVWGDSAWGRRLQQLGDNSVWDEVAGSAPVGGYYPPGPYHSGPPCPGSYSPPDDFGFRRLLSSADSPSEVLQALRSVGSSGAKGGDLVDPHGQLPMLDVVPRAVAGVSRGLKEWYDEPPSAVGPYGYGPSPPPYYGSGAGAPAAFTSDPVWGAARRSLMEAPSFDPPCGHYGYYHCAPPPAGGDDNAFDWPEHDGRKLQALREQLMME